ncbi:HotDog domain-containing protein [Blastocladiella britannica]|nr:HotDog domain-containing protein [Blastocladiella britannica]
MDSVSFKTKIKMSVARSAPNVSDYRLEPVSDEQLGLFVSDNSKGFSKLAMGKLTLLAEMEIQEGHLNGWNTLHGGMVASIIDLATSIAYVAAGHRHSGMSSDLSVSYIKAAPQGTTVLIVAEVDKLGQNLLFSRAALYVKETGDLIATGRHTKFAGGALGKL